VVIAGHLGSSVSPNGQWATTRDLANSEDCFHDLLRHLGTDHVDVVNITVVDKKDDLNRIMGPGGLYELADRLRRQGKARFIGISGHTDEVGLAVAAGGRFDVMMQPVNVMTPQEKVGPACAEAGVGLIGMKPFCGGELFHPPYSEFITPVMALSYALSRPGVSALVPGVSNTAELRDALAYVDAGEAERDFRPVMDNFKERVQGACQYCGHCLPCSADIPIPDVIWALRAHQRGSSYGEHFYQQWHGKVQCTECGECLDRCPFGVDIIDEIKEAVRVFEEAPD